MSTWTIRLAFAATALSFLSGCATVTLADRGIRDVTEEERTCSPFGLDDLGARIAIARVGADDYNTAEVANQFVNLSAASDNAYHEEKEKTPAGASVEERRRGTSDRFLADLYGGESRFWNFLKRVDAGGGLQYDQYFSESVAGTYLTLIAFRGTEFTSLQDLWFGNLSWLSQFLPGPNQYATARAHFARMRLEARANAAGRQVYFFATGHSLGGGLARHIAAAFPCTSAVVFNTSPVTLESRLTPPITTGLVIDIVEREDELRKISSLIARFERDKNYVQFKINTNPKGTLQHADTPMAVGMARFMADCLLAAKVAKGSDRDCRIRDLAKAALAKSLYCDSRHADSDRGVCE